VTLSDDDGDQEVNFFPEFYSVLNLMVDFVQVEEGFGTGLDEAMHSYASDETKRKAMDGLQNRVGQVAYLI